MRVKTNEQKIKITLSYREAQILAGMVQNSDPFEPKEMSDLKKDIFDGIKEAGVTIQ